MPSKTHSERLVYLTIILIKKGTGMKWVKAFYETYVKWEVSMKLFFK